MLIADLETGAGEFRLRAGVRVEAGRTLVLFGASGSGKSMLLRALAGIHRPVRGRIELDGEPLLDSKRGIDVPPQDRRLGYVPQSYALFPHLTVAENVGFGLRGLPAGERHRRVGALLATLQLDGLAERRPGQLSGGQQQRVALARALAPQPRALLLDEPFAALDAPLRRLLGRELQTLRHRFGFAVLFVTHDLADAFTLGDSIAVLDAGRIVQAGPPGEILYRPATPAVARLTGMRNVFPARVSRVLDGALEVTTDRFTAVTPPYPFPAGAAVDLYVRPELVLLVKPGHDVAPQQGQEISPERRVTLLRGKIVDEVRLGPAHTLYVRLSPDAQGDAPSSSAYDGQGSPSHRSPIAPGIGDPGYDLEIDIAPHPYQALRVGERRDWTLALPATAIHLTAGQPSSGPPELEA